MHYLDRNDEMAAVLKEVVCVDGDYSSLIRLSDIGENRINHSNEHSILVRVSGIFNDRNNVGPLFGNIEQISSGSVGEFNGVNQPFL